MIRAHLCSSALAITLISGPAMARDQKAPETDVAGRTGATALADLVVTATRSTQPIEKVGSSVTILTTEAIKASQATTAVELLVQTPSVSYSRNGGAGSATSLYIRGAENQHTVVLIDGVKLNDPSSTQGGFNAGNLLVGDISRIEVLRGGQSTLWGSQAIGGVINLVTAEPTAAFESFVSGEGGARNTAYLRAGTGGIGDHLTWRVAGSYYTTDGFSAYAGGKEKDAYQNSGLSARMRLAINPAASVEIRTVYSRGKADFDGFNTDSAEFGRTDELVVYSGLNFTLLDGRWNNRLGYGYTDTDRENFNPSRVAQPLTFDAAGKNRRWEYQGAFALNDAVTSNFGAERERSTMRTRSPSQFAPNPAFKTGRIGVDSVYGQIQAEPVSGLTLTGGLRHEDHDAYGAHSLGQASAAWSLNEGKTVVRASFGQGFRAPGLYELFSEYGNQQLQAEAFDSWDIGTEQQFWGRKARISATVFKREADNEIRFFSCSSTTVDPLCRPGGVQRFGYYKNIQKTRAKGLELIGQVLATDRLSVVGNYTFTESENASGSNSGKQLTRRPKNLANISATYRWPVGLRTTVAARHVGKTYNNEANTVVVQGYTLVDLRASYPINDRLEVYGRLENAFDEAYQTILNYGTPGRGAFLGLRAKF
ncbi:TonB-dependent receptor plug domain-containing protein [Caulobacter henricii]|uniref:TonB-dependent receptor n=1 Tax=Caulobacter henricii TaxID=69395 RepID=A0A0P0P067_9CAUL|nr:TonB-dependent receptor [Caulobacter henricii]ALL13439.1 TonB-dependent receptor [Caulobacter henricii]